MTNYTAALRLAKPVVGAETDTWGTTLNTNNFDMIDEAVGGQVSVSVTSADVTLTTNNGTTDQSRPAVLILTGSPGTTRTVTFPDVKQVRTVINNSDSTCTLKSGAGTTFSLPAGETVEIYTDGATNLARLRPQYKEGSFTPTMQFGGASTGITYSIQTGEYTKIGNRLFWSISISLSSKGSATGAATIGGLPYTPTGSGAMVIRWQNVNLDAVSGYTSLSATISGGVIQLKAVGDNLAFGPVADTDFSNTSNLTLSGHFTV